MIGMAEYIWMDGAQPTQKLRSKARMVDFKHQGHANLDEFPAWSYDGSSTYQASGDKSDLELRPVSFVKDPVREGNNYLVMCEVFNANGTPHSTNTRAKLREVLEKGGAKLDSWFGFEQEYTLFTGRTPLGWPEDGYPAPQGPFYCGVGSDEAFGRELVDNHAQACIDAGIMIYGINAEVMPGQWEYQIGYRGFKGESADPLTICDHSWIARWLLYRLGEDFGITATLDPKPVKGDWNGAGQHTNFSTAAMRDAKTGMKAVEEALNLFSKKHQEHIAEYGHGLADRLTGRHETCDINTFKHGESDRGASIRIPLATAQKGYGYLEDRRPGANADPYRVAARILKTLCKLD